jgi:hypothetical protein
MKKLISILIMVAVLTMGLMVAAAPSAGASTLADSVDFGTPSSESGHSLVGWGPIEPTTSTGGWGNIVADPLSPDKLCRPTWAPDESDLPDESWARFTLSTATGMTAQTLKLRVLDGVGNDTFEVKVNDNLVLTYTDVEPTWDDPETWTIYTFNISGLGLSGALTIEINSLADKWTSWDTYGQLGVDWAELYAEPTHENKDVSYNPITTDGIYGFLTFAPIAPTFNYTFEGYGLADGGWSLIYYADPWPGIGNTSSTGALIGIGTVSGGTGRLSLSGNVELNTDLPNSDDLNYPIGAKTWLIPSSYYSTTTPGAQGNVTGWPGNPPAGWLFDMSLITYQDAPTPTPPSGPSPTPGEVADKHCFIATAAYGSYLDSHVDTLRDFRDAYLETNPVGASLVSLYYKTSPPIAQFIDEHPAVKPVVRAALMPAVAMSKVALSTTLAQKIAILAGIALVSLALVVCLRRWAFKRG